MIVGFLVNPIAGMGGPVGLKGTDGEDTLTEAMARGGVKTAPGRAVTALKALRSWKLDCEFVTCSGEMGKDELEEAGLPGRVVYSGAERTTREDTLGGLASFLEERAELIVFVGGDGTARDVLDAVDQKVTVIGVPAGVKMHSGVFVNAPEDLAELMAAFLKSRKARDGEVMDVDERAFRQGIASARLYGLLRVPDDPDRLQASKTSYHSGSADDEAEEIGQYIAETMREGVLYVLGPGSTTSAIAKAIGCEKTLLGVDVYLDRKLVCKDADEKDLVGLLARGRKAEAIVTPIGAQGFFLGRGNQQISPNVLSIIGADRVTVVATPTKLAGTEVLRVDTGDSDLDGKFRGTRRVVTGYRRRKLVRVR